jgi:TetR/AcrR family transcriptional repressor of nem operon
MLAQTVDNRAVTGRGLGTRARIVAAAAELMFRQGVAGTSIPDVRQTAKVSTSQVYHYFGDKQGLVRAAIDHQIEATLDHQRPLLDSLDSFEALEAWRDGAIALHAMRDRGELRSDTDVDSLAVSLLAAVQGGLLLTQVRRSTEPFYAAVTSAIEYVRTFATTPRASEN